MQIFLKLYVEKIILKYGWSLVNDWGVCYGKKLSLQITKTLANCTQMDTISKSDVVLVKKNFVSVHVASEHV